jgi:alkanesulfonate monooxygenase SsuD/methylene tetrahydromethanopterin reductase-like flavin-dependent oxidoreductase (luciferase family)
VSAGAYKPDEARSYLDALTEQRRRAGRDAEPFAVYLSLWARPDPDLYRRFEESYGVTDMLCAPAMMAPVAANDPPEMQLRARVEASARFADTILAAMR